ncbi:MULTISPECIES: hypothetical protein [Aquimarina]|uniref:Uncharacterized protein n=1 Tax=Aquimarina algiphila TaxID=2047982 RepID=A0A554VKK1_9FLAO|nr:MULTISPECIES: hypothetical protein [Aquimarina]TSE08550.1 hypothetical protein FOF46_12320 [Aquimarina algiphila]
MITPNFKKRELVTRLLIFFLTCILLTSGTVLLSSHSNDKRILFNSGINKKSTFYFTKSEALIASHSIINRRLRSSTITSFGNNDENVRIINDTTFTVVNYVEWIDIEGKNQRNYYSCTVTFNQDCTTNAKNLVFLE